MVQVKQSKMKGDCSYTVIERLLYVAVLSSLMTHNELHLP